jgi:SagB-type dehydrogenase family enzyme
MGVGNGKESSGSSRPGAEARAFHEATKHSVQSVRERGHFLSWDNKPNPFKVIPGSGRIELPRGIPPTGVPLLEAVRRSAPAARRSPGLLDLALLLVVGAGVRRRVVYADEEEFFFRTYASAGALYPVEIYVVCADLSGLPAGVYHFDARGAALERLREGDHRAHLVRAAGAEPAVAQAPVTMVLTGIPWRTAWKYTERGYRHLYWDAGMILANLLALASATTQQAKVILGFVDDEVEALLGLDRAREFPLCLLTVGSRSPVGPGESPPESWTHPFPPLSPGEVEYQAIGEVNDAGRLATPEAAQEWRARTGTGKAGAEQAKDTFRPVLAPPPPYSIEEVIRRRGSARRFRRGSMPLGVLARVLEVATESIPTDLAPRILTDVYLAANAVEGLDPGTYVYQRGSFELLGRGDHRRRAAFLCLEQRLGGDAAATHFLLADLSGVLETWGDRGYRAAQLEAGIVGGKIYLGAYGYGYGATGLTFYDDEVISFFSPHAAGKSCMLVVAVGESIGRPDLRPTRRPAT